MKIGIGPKQIFVQNVTIFGKSGRIIFNVQLHKKEFNHLTHLDRYLLSEKTSIECRRRLLRARHDCLGAHRYEPIDL